MTIQDYTTTLCSHLGLEESQFSLEVREDEDSVKLKLTLPEEESGLFIGFHGETLQAIQRLIRISFYKELEGKILQFNVNDYREQRAELLEERVVNIALRVQRTGEAYTFSFLTANDRYLVHTTLANDERFKDLVSESSGEGLQRYLTIRQRQADE